MKNYKTLFVCVVMVILAQILRGQEKENFSDYGPKMAVKLNLMAMIDFTEPTFALAFEHRLKGKHYLEHEFGYIYANPWLMPKDLRGFRYRLGYHYVYNENFSQYKYFGVQVHYRQLYSNVEEFVWRQNRNFQQKTAIESTFHSYGFTVLGGKVRYFGERWYSDLQVGLGFSWKPFNLKNYPIDSENPNYITWMYNSQNYAHDGVSLRNGDNPIYLNMLFTVKVGYVIK
jgi:hypothetical protein